MLHVHCIFTHFYLELDFPNKIFIYTSTVHATLVWCVLNSSSLYLKMLQTLPFWVISSFSFGSHIGWRAALSDSFEIEPPNDYSRLSRQIYIYKYILILSKRLFNNKTTKFHLQSVRNSQKYLVVIWTTYIKKSRLAHLGQLCYKFRSSIIVLGRHWRSDDREFRTLSTDLFASKVNSWAVSEICYNNITIEFYVKLWSTMVVILDSEYLPNT